MNLRKKIFNKHGIIYIMMILVALGIVLLKVGVFDPSNLEETSEYSAINTEQETCKNCHIQNTGFSEYHNPELIGCVSCHLGNPNAVNKEESHNGMVLIPGNLSNADATCGTCHKEELNKIKHSLMTTNSGLVAVDKFIFGEAETPDDHYHIKNIEYTPADKHLRDLCANCHLGADKTEFGEINQLSRGGGCNACHLNYSAKANNDLLEYINSDKKILPKAHPATDIFVKDKHCFGCHSRSSRISTNYQGWHETLLEETDVLNKDGYKVFEDKRVYSFQGEDVHHAKGMLCIDCHSSHEVMGDGKDYLHEENAVTLNCADCHYKDQPNTIVYDSLDKESTLVFLHRKYTHQDKKILIAKKDGHPLVNTFVDDSSNVFLIGKGDGKLHEIKKQGESCSRDAAHKNVSCSSCHAQWAPRCIGCHNSFDKNDKDGYDLLDKKEVTGQWIEYVSEFNTSKPSLGVRFTKSGKTIEPAIPGMIMTIDHASYGNSEKMNSFHRLYAPNSPHTIAKIPRDCKSCHSNPIALGFGMGELRYNVSKNSGNWSFIAAYDLNPNDDLPEDAWIPFMEEQTPRVYSTRTDFRPFTVKEQKQLLLVGACLECHAEDSSVMKRSLEFGLDSLLLNLSEECILPMK